MLRIKCLFIIIVSILFFPFCVDYYNPDFKDQQINNLVVFGTINNDDSVQTIEVLRAAPINKPEILHETGCVVVMTDDIGNTYIFPETEPGKYRLKIPKENIREGISFQLTINTLDGQTIQSDFEKVFPCADVGNFYYEREIIPTNNPDLTTEGYQFYTDFNGAGLNTKYYRFELVETWEYHAAYTKQFYFNGRERQLIPADSSTKFCWQTRNVAQIYTASLANSNSGERNRLKLNTITNKTDRLKYGYSLLLKQQALSEKAYKYWEKFQKNTTTEVGLYESQPISIKGNLHNQTNPSHIVYGYFQVVSQKSKRIFIPAVKDLDIQAHFDCSLGGFPLPKEGWRAISEGMYPVYFLRGMYGTPFILELGCVDCRTLGGVVNKPDFWPEK